jgi:ssDNA-binding replication factor A large subunit
MGRVSAKSGIKNYNNAKGPGKLFNFNIIDQSVSFRFNNIFFTIINLVY